MQKVIASASYPIHRYVSIPIPFRPPYRYGLPFLDIPFMLKCSKMQFDKKNMFFSLNDHIVGIVADLYNGEEYIISEETIDSDEVKNYEIKFWVDKTYVNNGHYHGKIIVEETK